MAKVAETKKYAKYVSELAVPVPPGIMKMRHIALCDANYLPAATHHVEVITWTSTGSAYIPGKPSPILELPEEFKKRPPLRYAFDLQPSRRSPMYHTYDEVFVFVGTNPDDPLDLGGQIELWLGAGEHAEKQVITKSSYVFVPAGMVHCPLDCTKFVRPFIEIVIAPSPIHTEFHVDVWPPGYEAPFK